MERGRSTICARLSGLLVGVLLGFGATLSTIAAAAFGAVAAAAWYINRQPSYSFVRTTISVGAKEAALAAAGCGGIAAALWLTLIVIAKRGARAAATRTALHE